MYPEATSEEIVADILEELIKKVEDEIEWNIQERELHALDLDLIEEMKVEVSIKILKELT